jgi:hypothetical protein
MPTTDAPPSPVPANGRPPGVPTTIIDQPPPVPSARQAVWDLVIADMRERDQLGRERYGTPLQAFNGRRPLVDAYQELLDLVVYLRQELEERARPDLAASDEVARSHEDAKRWHDAMLDEAKARAAAEAEMFGHRDARIAAESRCASLTADVIRLTREVDSHIRAYEGKVAEVERLTRERGEAMRQRAADAGHLTAAMLEVGGHALPGDTVARAVRRIVAERDEARAAVTETMRTADIIDARSQDYIAALLAIGQTVGVYGPVSPEVEHDPRAWSLYAERVADAVAKRDAAWIKATGASGPDGVRVLTEGVLQDAARKAWPRHVSPDHRVIEVRQLFAALPGPAILAPSRADLPSDAEIAQALVEADGGRWDWISPTSAASKAAAVAKVVRPLFASSRAERPDVAEARDLAIERKRSADLDARLSALTDRLTGIADATERPGAGESDLPERIGAAIKALGWMFTDPVAAARRLLGKLSEADRATLRPPAVEPAKPGAAGFDLGPLRWERVEADEGDYAEDFHGFTSDSDGVKAVVEDCGDWYVGFSGKAGGAETGKATVEAIHARVTGQTAPVRKPCRCTSEAGDTPECPAHPTCDECGEPQSERSTKACEEHRAAPAPVPAEQPAPVDHMEEIRRSLAAIGAQRHSAERPAPAPHAPSEGARNAVPFDPRGYIATATGDLYVDTGPPDVAHGPGGGGNGEAPIQVAQGDPTFIRAVADLLNGAAGRPTIEPATADGIFAALTEQTPAEADRG